MKLLHFLLPTQLPYCSALLQNHPEASSSYPSPKEKDGAPMQFQTFVFNKSALAYSSAIKKSR